MIVMLSLIQLNWLQVEEDRNSIKGRIAREHSGRIVTILGELAIGRKSIEAGESYQLREAAAPYIAHFGVKNVDTEPKNTYF